MKTQSVIASILGSALSATFLSPALAFKETSDVALDAVLTTEIQDSQELLIAQNISVLPRTFFANLKITEIQLQYSLTLRNNTQVLEYIQRNAYGWYSDRDNDYNVQILARVPTNNIGGGGQSAEFLRATIDPTRSRVISAGYVRESQLQSFISAGRYIRTSPR